jgi:hypothetical protein
MMCLFQTKQSARYAGNDSPRPGFAGRPSLHLRWKEGRGSFFEPPSMREAERGGTSEAM